MAKSKKEQETPPKDFQLIKAIRSEKLYKSNIQNRDKYARKYIDENLSTKSKSSILPGQLIMFNYFEPATEEQLEYYDAMPCTIFFGVTNTKDGKRVIGFNIHYYPPKIRYLVLDKIFEIFKQYYLPAWNKGLTKEIKYIEYQMLMEQLEKAKLDFGVRMYIPKLMHKVTPIPVKLWSKVVFTEGKFKKRTREAIMNYWRNKKIQ